MNSSSPKMSGSKGIRKGGQRRAQKRKKYSGKARCRNYSKDKLATQTDNPHPPKPCDQQKQLVIHTCQTLGLSESADTPMPDLPNTSTVKIEAFTSTPKSGTPTKRSKRGQKKPGCTAKRRRMKKEEGDGRNARRVLTGEKKHCCLGKCLFSCQEMNTYTNYVCQSCTEGRVPIRRILFTKRCKCDECDCGVFDCGNKICRRSAKFYSRVLKIHGKDVHALVFKLASEAAEVFKQRPELFLRRDIIPQGHPNATHLVVTTDGYKHRLNVVCDPKEIFPTASIKKEECCDRDHDRTVPKLEASVKAEHLKQEAPTPPAILGITEAPTPAILGIAVSLVVKQEVLERESLIQKNQHLEERLLRLQQQVSSLQTENQVLKNAKTSLDETLRDERSRSDHEKTISNDRIQYLDQQLQDCRFPGAEIQPIGFDIIDPLPQVLEPSWGQWATTSDFICC